MAIEAQYADDAAAILSHRHDGGADFWTTPDNRLIKGTPFSAYTSAQMLLELGAGPDDPLLQGVAELFFDAWREDGRFKLYPSGAIYPCHTAEGAQILCRMGYAEDARVEATFRHLLENTYAGGGWRCNKFSFGHGPETEYATPFTTLAALDAFRHSHYLNRETALDAAVEFLLWHWQEKRPVGPCHYGIGTLFMQPGYPLFEYNLFHYVHTLSFYKSAQKDRRFLQALAALQSKLENGMVVVQRVAPKLAKLRFCQKGKPSALATKRYQQILRNLNANATAR